MSGKLTNRRILVGISGGIAAYKSAELVRRLIDLGADVRVTMTKAAQEFITPLTLQALSGKPVSTELLDTSAEAAMGHIELARWADLILIAPASADIISRLAQGSGDDILTTICLARRCPLAIAPAMNQAMWHNNATQKNLATLKVREIHQLGPDEGGQACGDLGFGRMSEPADLALEICHLFSTRALEGKTVVITAGPTREAIDPVRYISNYSSGKMGYALAQAAADAGAKTILISGPTALKTPEHVRRIDVISADEMLQASMDAVYKSANSCDIFIASAAVADFKPVAIAPHKIKKNDQHSMTLEMVKNPDIVATIAAQANAPFTVGFAAETQQLLEHAKSKLAKKQLDIIIANDVSNSDIGFDSDNNALTIVTKNDVFIMSQKSKKQLAVDIISYIATYIDKISPGINKI
ncbi:MAG: phosphopantothenoylcysteine decarboxylase/phosphopantothenate--cysteine ligase [Cellvibrionaceae bacterium]|jgi:phosphopantothenoylcysteine decarboxylase/phosphopantothenate--cysteine ligase